MKLSRTVVVDKPRELVFDYLADFTTTQEWDPGTISTVRTSGDGTVATSYLNTSRFLGRTTQLTYVVEEFVENEHIRLRGTNRTVTAVDTITFSGSERTEVTYTAEFSFRGPARYLAPLFAPAFTRLGDRAREGMLAALNRLG